MLLIFLKLLVVILDLSLESSVLLVKAIFVGGKLELEVRFLLFEILDSLVELLLMLLSNSVNFFLKLLLKLLQLIILCVLQVFYKLRFEILHFTLMLLFNFTQPFLTA